MRSSAEAQGALKPSGGSMSQFPDVSVLSPRKAGQICGLVRGKNVDEALAILKYTPRGAASIIAKVVKSAKANAENNHEMDVEKLYIASIA